jgi:hypothetical protein
MTQTEALRLALDALKNGKRVRDAEGGTKYQPDLEDQAITAIKAALEKKAENAEELGLDYYVPCCTDQTCSKCKAALEAKDEIRAWIEHHKGGDNLVWDDPSGERTPLYTTPQRTWVGLTDEEIDEWTPEIHVVIRAIEAKLKEKNA